MGLEFGVVDPAVSEIADGEPEEVVATNAERKAAAGVELAERGAVVVGSDTEVVLDGRVLGKPADPEAARARLEQLAGREHLVLSAVCVRRGGRVESGREATAVRFRELRADEITAYVATGEWRGRAGGYAVQGMGSSMVAAITGDLSNVIGLPLPLTMRLLEGIAVPESGSPTVR